VATIARRCARCACLCVSWTYLGRRWTGDCPRTSFGYSLSFQILSSTTIFEFSTQIYPGRRLERCCVRNLLLDNRFRASSTRARTLLRLTARAYLPEIREHSGRAVARRPIAALCSRSPCNPNVCCRNAIRSKQRIWMVFETISFK
jgi:hypothetical protein